MYKGSNNVSIKEKSFGSIKEFEEFLNDPFKNVVEILKYNSLDVYAGGKVVTNLGVEVTIVINNKVYI